MEMVMGAENKQDNKRELIEAVGYTIIYYNVSGYPPTTFEIWKHLIRRPNMEKRKYGLVEVAKVLVSGRIKKDFSCLDSFWVLKGNEELVRQRIKKQKITIKKIRKLRKWARMAGMLPYLRGIFINGTLAMKRAGADSDWDVLLVMKKDRIWAGRLFVSLFFHIFFKRRHHDKIKDRFCLNHFLSEDGLVLEENSAYSSSEMIFSTPIFGKEVFDRFIQLNEGQMKKFKFNYEREELNDFFLVRQGKAEKFLKKIWEVFLEWSFLGNLINRVSRRLMIMKIDKNPKTYMEGSDIRYSDQALVFLPQPRRVIVSERAEALFKARFGD